MKRKPWRAMMVAGTVLLSLVGCGTGSTSGANSDSQNTQWYGQGRAGGFQLNLQMSTDPATPSAGKPFTIKVFMQRPNRSANRGTPGNTTTNRGNARGNFGNHTGNWTGAGQGGNPPQRPNLTATISGGSVNKTVTLSSQANEHGVWEGQVTLPSKGTYKVTVTMNFRQQQIQKEFTLTVH